jgi:hypothetical protein
MDIELPFRSEFQTKSCALRADGREPYRTNASTRVLPLCPSVKGDLRLLSPSASLLASRSSQQLRKLAIRVPLFRALHTQSLQHGSRDQKNVPPSEVGGDLR